MLLRCLRRVGPCWLCGEALPGEVRPGRGWWSSTELPCSDLPFQGPPGLCAAQLMQLRQTETWQGYQHHQMPTVVLAQPCEGCWIPAPWRWSNFVTDHPNHELRAEAEVGSFSACTAPCLPLQEVAFCVWAAGSNCPSNESWVLATGVCVQHWDCRFSCLGSWDAGLGSLMAGLREVAQCSWLPQPVTLTRAGPARSRQDDFQLHRPVPKFQF